MKRLTGWICYGFLVIGAIAWAEPCYALPEDYLQRQWEDQAIATHVFEGSVTSAEYKQAVGTDPATVEYAFTISKIVKGGTDYGEGDVVWLKRSCELIEVVQPVSDQDCLNYTKAKTKLYLKSYPTVESKLREANGYASDEVLRVVRKGEVAQNQSVKPIWMSIVFVLAILAGTVFFVIRIRKQRLAAATHSPL